MGKVFRQVTELIHSKHSPTTPYHPQTDGQCERMIGTLTGLLARLAETENDWDEQLPFALYAYRGAVHETTKETPFFMVYGRDPNGPTETAVKEWVEKKEYVKKYTEEIVERLEAARSRIVKEAKKNKERVKKEYDKRRIESDYRIGDLVWMRSKEKEMGQHHKMAKRWTGPFRIFAIHEENTSVVEICNVWNRTDKRNVNIVLLKRAYVRDGDQIPEDVEVPIEEVRDIVETEKGKEKEVEETNIVGKQKKKRGRRAGRKVSKGKKNEEVETNRREIRNKEGRTKYTQARNEGVKNKEWTKEELEKEWVVEKIVQEIRLHHNDIQYRVQFKGFKKLSDAGWMDEDVVKDTLGEIYEEWEAIKKRRGVRYVDRIDGLVTMIK